VTLNPDGQIDNVFEEFSFGKTKSQNMRLAGALFVRTRSPIPFPIAPASHPKGPRVAERAVSLKVGFSVPTRSAGKPPIAFPLVCFAFDSDQIADIARGRFRGQQQTLASFSNLVDDSK